MTPVPSYRLKLKRAEEHLVEIGRHIAPYSEVRPYDVRHSVEGKAKKHVYRMYPGLPEPDPWLAILIGVFFFNVRSSLDHLRAALVPPNRRYSGAFPIHTEDPFQKDPATGQYLQRLDSARKFWTASTKGMGEEAVRKIDDLQPFRLPEAEVENSKLAIVSRLNNADKHRQLVTVIDLLRPESVIERHADRTTVTTPRQPPDHVAVRPGARFHATDAEVEVEACGAIEVAIRAGEDRAYRLPDVLASTLVFIHRRVLDVLEPLVPT